MTQQITHPSHQNHVLSLLPRPTHTLLYHCDACGNQINDASFYQCRACNIDLHINCATLPMSVTHPSHPHQLNLAFSPPYSTGMFGCNICTNPGSRQWVYHCSLCQFDAHLGYANTNPGVAIQAPTALPQTQIRRYQAAPVQNPSYLQVPAGTQFATRFPLNNHPAPSNYVNNTNRSSYIRPNVGNVLNHASEGFAYGTSQAAGYNFGQGLLGGGPNDGGDGGANDGGDWNDWGAGGDAGWDCN